MTSHVFAMSRMVLALIQMKFNGKIGTGIYGAGSSRSKCHHQSDREINISL